MRTVAKMMGYPLKIVFLPESHLEKVDGVLIPGGPDIDPRLYLDSVTPELRAYTEKNMSLAELTEEGRIRDSFEIEVLRRYMKDDQFKDLPLLGVCRGMQMMTVAQGLPLYLDIKTELKIPNRRFVTDEVQVEEGPSLMDSLYGHERVYGFKMHHQGLRMSYFHEQRENYPGVKITATSHDGKIAEAIEFTDRPALGVQYHPEKSYFKTAYPVFEWFFTKACEYKNTQR